MTLFAASEYTSQHAHTQLSLPRLALIGRAARVAHPLDTVDEGTLSTRDLGRSVDDASGQAPGVQDDAWVWFALGLAANISDPRVGK